MDLDTTLSLRKPEVQVIVDREAASDLGIPVGDIADTLRILVGGMPVSKFRDGDEQYDVWLRAEAGDRSSIKELEDLSVPSPKAGLVRISSLAKLVDERGPSEIERYGRQRIVTVLGNPETIPLGEAVSRARTILEEMKLPPQYSFEFSGQAKTMGETGYYFMVAFGLSVLFMYMILAAQFESWTQPVVDPDGAAGDGAVRPALAGPVPHADGHLRDVRPVHAGRHREEERHLAGRRDQPAPRPGACRGTRRSSRPTTRGCGRS